MSVISRVYCIMFLDIIHRPVFIQEHSLSETSSVSWAQLSRFCLNTETESNHRNIVFDNIKRTVFLDEDRTMDNVQKHNICINVPSSQTFRSSLLYVHI
jgi:hypothetical protein